MSSGPLKKLPATQSLPRCACRRCALAPTHLRASTSLQPSQRLQSSCLVNFIAMAALGGLLGAYGSDEEDEEMGQDQPQGAPAPLLHCCRCLLLPLPLPTSPPLPRGCRDPEDRAGDIAGR